MRAIEKQNRPTQSEDLFSSHQKHTEQAVYPLALAFERLIGIFELLR